MSVLDRKRVSAAEAADILGVPRNAISRIDRAGEFIRRYKLGHKTYVYDVESLEQFLLAKEVRPISKPSVGGARDVVPAAPRKSSGLSPLQHFLREKQREWDMKKTPNKS
ncbi:helix-turn-helix transcriptional regulator [Paraburkholderia azotifigens]|uniref:helix-turn-helix transcriptional regulator n=1 Tax=Paraburkholderia azotifigens TaxID=2057004 RepID=UPI0038B8DF4F